MRTIKIPVNVSEINDYEPIVSYARQWGWDVCLYLSSSPFSIRANQDHWEHFMRYVRMFKAMNEPVSLEVAFNIRYSIFSEPVSLQKGN